jgi:hypothetical protein
MALKKAVTFDPNQMWLRALTNDNFFDFEPTRSFGYFAGRRDGEKRQWTSQTVFLGKSDTPLASR